VQRRCALVQASQLDFAHSFGERWATSLAALMVRVARNIIVGHGRASDCPSMVW
jgi:hypothetical protein